MSTGARREYGEQLRLRKAGFSGHLDPDATLVEAKPSFYADAHLLIDNVREVYGDFRKTAPPYGLVDWNNEPFVGFEGNKKRGWTRLEQLMSVTARKAFEVVTPPATGCPYHEVLRNLGHIPLKPTIVQSPDMERLREIVFPGAQFAPATIVNILKRMPAMAAANHARTDVETLAHNSAHALLQEPLHHSQQHAKAFTFCLADGVSGTDAAIDRAHFMPDDVIERYTQLSKDPAGREVVTWSMPTDDFVLRASVHVTNRLAGSERDISGDHIDLYPIGTRLGDIRVDEPTIGCPGSQLAYDMWDQALDVIVGEGLWHQPS